MKILRSNRDEGTSDQVKHLNIEIRNHYTEMEKRNVRRNIIPGNSKSLWKAVNIVKDINIESRVW